VQSTFTVQSVAWNDTRAIDLRAAMDAEMEQRYLRALPEPAETVTRRAAALAVDPASLVSTLLAVDNDGTPLGHAALRMHRGDWEIKRVIVAKHQRGRGIARALMTTLHDIARSGGARRVILQTGEKQPEAVSLYAKLGYTPIPVYEPYLETMPSSLCFEKVIEGE
jgi:GNAT superfamily N-acetyltransferase